MRQPSRIAWRCGPLRRALAKGKRETRTKRFAGLTHHGRADMAPRMTRLGLCGHGPQCTLLS